MAAHRYWRLVGFALNSNDMLELSEARLYAGGVAVDSTATLSCPFAPDTGALTDLKDGLTTAVVSWPFLVYRNSGFALAWDLGGTGADIDAIQFGGVNSNTFPCDFTLQYSDDSLLWATSVNVSNAGYAGGISMLSLVQYPLASLFAAGERGLWYDPSDMSTLFQDAAGTTPVTAVGQPVGKMLDKSGNANHATQASAGSRPVLRQDASGFSYLEFNGSSSALATASTQLSNADKLSVFFAITQNTGAVSLIAEFSANLNANAGAFYFAGSESSAGDVSFRNRGDGVAQIGGTSPGAATPITRVVTGLFDIAGTTIETEVVARISGSPVALTNKTSSTDSGAGNYGTYPLYIGARAGASLFFNGRLYGMVIRGVASSATQIDLAENWLAYKTSPSLATGRLLDLNPSPRLRGIPITPDRMVGAALPNGAASSHLREYAFFDAYHGGTGIVYGTVKEKNTPANTPLRRKVWLMDERSGLVIRETWSDAATGAYEFRGIKQGMPYTVLAYDHEHNYRAFAGDNLLPDPMP